MKANYFILYNYFTEITSGVSTFEGANQSAARNQCWFIDILVAFAILAKRNFAVTASDHLYLHVTVFFYYNAISSTYSQLFWVCMCVHGRVLLFLECFGVRTPLYMCLIRVQFNLLYNNNLLWIIITCWFHGCNYI